MRSLNDTITRLGALRARTVGAAPQPGGDRLSDLRDFGSNPGALRGRYYLPRDLRDAAALVVVLHGCTQTADGYDRGSGWSQLADEHGFALLFPEQTRANNPNLCFNWFNREDTRRDAGEALSIRQMVGAMIAAHGLDPARVYVTGLSAGGAMTSTMLATYPEVFAGGAIIAGLPYGTAASVPEAFDRMRGHGGPEAAALGALVASASGHDGPWPTVSVWHGDKDATVALPNAGLIVEQWRGLHGVPAQPSHTESVDGTPRRVWRDAAGRDVIEEYRIAGMGHGTPLNTFGADSCGAAGPYMLEARISSTRHIARFWGLIDDAPAGRAQPPHSARQPDADLPSEIEPLRETPGRRERSEAPADLFGIEGGIKRVIDDALRAAGLTR
jgi:poly(hydroxyalkanoate) depolymerase family esterase